MNDVTATPIALGDRIDSEVRNIGIPPRPTILIEIDKEMHRNEPDFRRLADLIASDVGLSAGIIKVANSPFFGGGKSVRSSGEALIKLGLRLVGNTIAGIMLQKTFPHVPSLERFWDSAARTARLSRWLALHLKRQITAHPDDAYTFGLFRDAGIPVLMIPFPEYVAVLKQANAETERCFTAIEDETMGINHAVVGAALTRDWALPADVVQAIQYHHTIRIVANEGDPGNTGDAGEAAVTRASRELIAIAQLAEFLIQQATGMSHTHEWEKMSMVCLRLLAIDATQLEILSNAASEVIAAPV